LGIGRAQPTWLNSYKLFIKIKIKSRSTIIFVFDGPHAGQATPYVHIHILPRAAGDFEKKMRFMMLQLDEKERELKQKLDLDKERKYMRYEEMALEAAEYRKLFS
ncbi:hypothetical protein MKW94_006358, partial [Papaver nudicaule]|nr:hypothetical protein [Papaver nudicaule]